MITQKLLISTFASASALAAPTAVWAAPWNNNDNDDWGDNDDDDWGNDDDDGGHGWGNDGGHGGGWNDHGDVKLRQLRFIDKGTRLVAFGQLERLKKSTKPARIVIKARGDATAVCINPQGKIPPGKNPVDADEVTATGRAPIDLTSFYKGSVEFKVATDKPDLRVDGAPDCPNWKWTEKIVDVAFTEVEIDVVQDGKKVLELECFFAKPTRDGKVASKNFDCEAR